MTLLRHSSAGPALSIALIVGLVVALIAPGLWVLWGVRHTENAPYAAAGPPLKNAQRGGSLTSFGGFGTTSSGLASGELTWLRHHNPHERWIVAVHSDLTAEGPIIDGYSVMPWGGFYGTDSAMTREPAGHACRGRGTPLRRYWWIHYRRPQSDHPARLPSMRTRRFSDLWRQRHGHSLRLCWARGVRFVQPSCPPRWVWAPVVRRQEDSSSDQRRPSNVSSTACTRTTGIQPRSPQPSRAPQQCMHCGLAPPFSRLQCREFLASSPRALAPCALRGGSGPASASGPSPPLVKRWAFGDTNLGRSNEQAPAGFRTSAGAAAGGEF